MKRTALLFTIFTAAICSKAVAQSFDTTGIANWPTLINSYDTWMSGAFDANRDTTNPTDFGWGNYSQQTHIIEGDSIYILKTVAGHYKAISINQLASGTFTFTYSDLDGSNRVTKTVDRKPYNTKNFFYYSMDTETVKDLEPAAADWDIVFRKYLALIPGYGGYPVAGVLSNRNVEVSQVEFQPGGSYSVNDTAQHPMSTDISTIGYDWKSAGPSGATIHDTVVYYVKDQNGNVNELKFTGYGGAATGKMKFTVNGQADSIALGNGNEDQVYYSLQNQGEIATNSDKNWDIGFFAQSSFSSVPVRINDAAGAELYVYPKSDIGKWQEIGLEEQSTKVLSVYPNPATDQLNMALHAAQGGEVEATLISPSGKIVKSRSFHLNGGVKEARLQVEDMTPGIYILKLDGRLHARSQVMITQ